MATADSFKDLLASLLSLQRDLIEAEAGLPAAQSISPDFRESARNLYHYVALRRHDLRGLQPKLAALGLSSLGRAEGWTLANLQAVIRVVSLLAGAPAEKEHPAADHQTGQSLLDAHTRALFGPAPNGRSVRIMVTMPGDAADNPELIRDLLKAGMNCMRINCAHGDAGAWERMIGHLRAAEASLGVSCKVLMDIAGPKLRTGPMSPGAAVVKWKPRRDEFGRVVAAARIWLTAQEHPSLPAAKADASLQVPGSWLSGLRVGDNIRFRDARERRRVLHIVSASPAGCWAESARTAYATPGTLLEVQNSDGEYRPAVEKAAPVGTLPAKPLRIRLKRGDTLSLTPDLVPGLPASVDPDTGAANAAHIGCTLPEIFRDVKTGERVWFDDGRIGGVVREVGPAGLRVEVTIAQPEGSWLGEDKGINFPDTTFHLPALTEQDREDLTFIAKRADMVGYSFVRDAKGVRELRAALEEYGGPHVGVVLKIETAHAFERLPDLLLSAMQGPAIGVMIARGDLAVECGFERLAEVQEEILWLCEAAHVPVVWATQVLENLSKTGMPSRAEITDAAMGERAECVMLNKGPHVLDAVRLLDGILRRMEGHQHKKRPMLRGLKVAKRFKPDG